jgi:hypothetical protein
LPVKECLRQALNERLIGSFDVAGEALAHPQAFSACGWARYSVICTFVADKRSSVPFLMFQILEYF